MDVAHLEDPRSKTFPIYETAQRDPPTTLHEAAERGTVNIIHRLVAKTADLDINKADRLGRTPLHWAVDMQHVEVVEALLDYGAKPACADGAGRTPIHIAAKHCNIEVLKLLVNNLQQDAIIAAVNAGDNNGLTPVFLSSQKGDEGVACLQFLMSCGAVYH